MNNDSIGTANVKRQVAGRGSVVRRRADRRRRPVEAKPAEFPIALEMTRQSSGYDVTTAPGGIRTLFVPHRIAECETDALAACMQQGLLLEKLALMSDLEFHILFLSTIARRVLPC